MPIPVVISTADAHGSEKENFFKEMKMMKMVSSAENEMKKFVVNMVGCVTVREPLLLIVEYVKHGDLQAYLRTIKKQVPKKTFLKTRKAGLRMRDMID